jgi:alpha-tubulin suppressor-like RCC1 family protein
MKNPNILPKLYLLVLAVLCGSMATAQCTYYQKIAAGIAAQFSLGLKSDSTVWAWGYNGVGQLGNGTTTQSNIPVQVSSLTGVIAIAAGTNHGLALKSDSTVWAWGYNGNGQLGNGTTTQSNIPVQVSGLTGIIAIAAGNQHSLALKSDGTVWTWGYNNNGELGNGNTTSSSTPVQFSGLTGIVAIAGGAAHSLALKSDSTVWAAGYNIYGQLGNGNTTQSTTAVQVSGLTGVVSLAGGVYHSLALKSDGTVWAWGYNIYGQLGNGNTTNQSTPVQVSALTGVTTITSSYYHNLALKSDGTLWAWGLNNFGQLGNGNTTNQSTPVQASTLTGIAAIASGFYHGLALQNNGTIWAWGRNALGQLGDGTTTNELTPEHITTAPAYSGLVSTNTSATATQTMVNYYNDGTCSGLIASVAKWGSNPISGSTTTRVWIESSQPAQYVGRHYQITPVSNASTSTGRITLYYTQADFDNFNAVNTVKLPASSSDSIGKSHLFIEKRGGTSSDGSGLPNTYSGSIINIDPNDTDIVWNSAYSRWEVSFTVSSFSGFFVKTTASILPLQWLTFTAQLSPAQQATLQWQVQEHKVKSYSVEKSTNGRMFTAVGQLLSQGDGDHSYSFTDQTPLQATTFYRIRQVDIDGKSSYSAVRTLLINPSGVLSLYPNPAHNQLQVSVPSGQQPGQAQIRDVSGRLWMTTRLAPGNTTLDIHMLPAGLYVMELTNGVHERFIKQ